MMRLSWPRALCGVYSFSFYYYANAAICSCLCVCVCECECVQERDKPALAAILMHSASLCTHFLLIATTRTPRDHGHTHTNTSWLAIFQLNLAVDFVVTLCLWSLCERCFLAQPRNLASFEKYLFFRQMLIITAIRTK